MFHIPSISEVEEASSEVPLSAFSKRRKVPDEEKTALNETELSRNGTSLANMNTRNIAPISEGSRENVISVDYKQVVSAAPTVSGQLKRAIAASSHNEPNDASLRSKDLFDIKDVTETSSITNNNKPIINRNYSGSTIYALNRQKGNPILKHIRNVPVEFVCDIAPDYILSEATCALYLSLRYHHLNPNYIYDRIRKVGSAFKLRLLLLQIDVIDPTQSLAELNKACFHADCTLLLAFSPQEAGRYLETYKVYQFKPVDLLRANIESDPTSRAIDFLTTIKVSC